MNESDLRSDVHYLGSSENPQFKYMTFIYSELYIHHLTGLFRTTIMTSPQLAC